MTIDFALDGPGELVTRTLQVPDSYTAYELHLCIQVALGWDDREAFEFVGAELTVGTEAKFAGGGITHGGHRYLHADEATVVDLLATVGERVSYTYDFGRFWTGKLTLAARSWELDELPSCTQASGVAPPELLEDREDLEALRAAYEDPSDGLHALAVATFGEDYEFGDPDPDEITMALEELFGEEVDPHGDTEAEEEDWGWWDPSKYDDKMRLRVLREEIEEGISGEITGSTAAERQAALLAALRGRPDL